MKSLSAINARSAFASVCGANSGTPSFSAAPGTNASPAAPAPV